MGHTISLSEVKGFELRLNSVQVNQRLNKELYLELDALEAYGIHSGSGEILAIQEKNIDTAIDVFKNKEILQFLKDAKTFCANGMVKILFD
jgi:hypothetical protein